MDQRTEIMFLSINTEKVMIKIKASLGIVGSCLNKNYIQNQPEVNIIPNGEKLKTLFLRNKTRNSFYLIQYLKSQLEQYDERRKQKEYKQQNKSQYCFLTDVKDSKEVLELINTFIKVTEHKINIKKSVAFLYYNSKLKKKPERSQP